MFFVWIERILFLVPYAFWILYVNVVKVMEQVKSCCWVQFQFSKEDGQNLFFNIIWTLM